MAQSRNPVPKKPTPKTQAELSNQLSGASTSLLGDPNLANPNFNGPNRSLQNSFEGDTVKPFSVSIQDIDEAIMYYFQNVIKPFVMQNGNRIEVPVIYGSPERWKSTQRDGYYKDKNGAIMAPLIMFKRNSIEKNRNLGNKLDANYPNLYGVMKKKYDTKNFYSNFNVLTNRIPEEQFYAVTIPDYLTLTYSCVVYTYYVEQLNGIIEAIEYASDSYWGNPQRYQFKAAIDSFTTVTELPQDDVRIVRSTFDIKIFGYIIPNTLQNNVSSLKKFRNKAKLIFAMETVDDPIVLDPNVPVQVDDSGRPNALTARSIAADRYNTFTPFPRSSPTYIDGSAVNSAAASLSANLQALTNQLQALEARIAALETNP
jgi:hypothetical protein